MLFVLSPAKTLDFTPGPEALAATVPEMRADIVKLARTTRKLKKADLKRLMDISDKLAELNVTRFKAFAPKDEDAGVQAALAFAGDVYIGLDARSFSAADFDYAQDHLRILSGLYGVLRPLDRIQPYRLEMGTQVHTRRGESLYDFWGAKIAKTLNAAAEGQADRTLVNLASQEYFGAVDRKALKLPLLSCQFKEEKDGELRIISFYAKAARGLMARFAIKNRVDRIDGLKDFALGGYRFEPKLSDGGEWVFARPQPAGLAAQKKAA
jgi:cytoplasmic iron level regulating protein YaaA (DUF328/UPF0246 family)